MLVIFIGRGLELSVHCEVAAVVSQPPVNLGTGEKLCRHAPLLVFDRMAALRTVIVLLTVIPVNQMVI